MSVSPKQYPMPDISASTVFANTVLVSQEAGQVPTLRTIGVLDQPRKKRRHCKSRRGCFACKRRRVKCDERLPCSSCVKRNVQCVQSFRHAISPSLSTTSARFEMHLNQDISLLHLELFNHWDKETRSTLTFPEVWPIVTQRAFHEEFVMSAILTLAGMHLATLCPQSAKYTHISMQLMAKTIRLFRENLSRPFNKDNCEALMGTALLINYISWADLRFLEGITAVDSTGLNLVQDQLFFLSPGIVHIWFQVMPIFIDDRSIFTQVMYQNPRRSIEDTLVKADEDPARFVEPFMRIWDDPRYQTLGCTAKETAVAGPTSRAWRLLLELESELLSCSSSTLASASISEGSSENQKLLPLKDAVRRITSKSVSVNHMDTSAALLPQLDRFSFEKVVRCMSPLLCCASLESASDEAERSGARLQADIEQLFYGFPVLCGGPFAELLTIEDSRALVLILCFYRAARILLAPKKCWWACARSCIMEKIILQELNNRGLNVSLTL